MRYTLTVATQPTVEPVSLSEAKLQCRIDGDDEDSLIERLISTAREYVAETTGRTFTTTVYTMTFSKFPYPTGRIDLPRSPVASVGSITYRDPDSATQTLSTSLYKVSAGDVYTPGYIVPKDGEIWPDTDDDPDSVTVTFTAGTAVASVPETVRHQILMLVAYWYARPETEGDMPKGFEKAFSMLGNLNTVPYLA